MLTLISELFLHSPNGSLIPLRCFEGHELPTLGKAFAPNTDTLSWTFGRHPECDVVWDRPVSTIHFTIFFDRSQNSWFIQDGGFYARPMKMTVPRGYKTSQNTDDRGIGFIPSTLGTFLNGQRLIYTQPEDNRPSTPRKMQLYPGDRIFAAGKKLYASDRAQLPANFDWQKHWIQQEDNGEELSPVQAQELIDQQKEKLNQSNVGVLAHILDRRLSKASLLERLIIYLLIGVVAIAVVVVVLGGAAS